MTEEDIKVAFEELQKLGFHEYELKDALSWLKNGFSLQVILLADKYVQQQRGKRDVRAVERMLWSWTNKKWITPEEIIKNMEPLMFEEKITSLLKLNQKLAGNEKRYIHQWYSLQMEDQMIVAAYERTILNTGGMNWAYMNKILQCWKENGYKTMEDISKVSAKSYQPFGKDAEIQKLKEENRSLLQKVAGLQDALLKEKDKMIQLLQERENEHA